MTGSTVRAPSEGEKASPLAWVWPPLVGVIGIPALAFIVFDGGTYQGIADQPIRVATQFITLALLAVWLIASALMPGIRVRTPLALVVGLMLLVLWASVLTSQRPRLSLEAGLTATATALGLLALLGLTRHEPIRARLRILIVGVALVVAAGYVIQVMLSWIHWWSFVGLRVPPLRPSGDSLSLGSANLIATYLLLVGPLAAVILWRSAGRWLAIAAAGLFVIGILICGSRGGYLGLAAVVVVLVPLVVVAGAGSAGTVARRIVRFVVSPRVAVAAVAILGVAALALGPAILARFDTGGESIRLSFWNTALQLFAAHPWLGTGPGTWPQLQLAVAQDPGLIAVVPHPHNAYVRLLSELGLVGAAMALVGFAVLGRRAIRALRGPEEWVRLETAAAVAGLAGLAAQCLVDDLTNLAGVILLGAILVAWIDSAAPHETGKAMGLRLLVRGMTRAVPALIVAGLLLAGPTLLRIDRAALTSSSGDREADSGDWAAAARSYREAVDLDGDLAIYRIELALALAQNGDLDGARAQYQLALEQDTLPENAVALAVLDAEAGDFPAAMRWAAVATSHAGRDTNLFVNAGRVAEEAGNPASATTWYAQAIVIDPPVAASTELTIDPAVRSAAIEQAAKSRSAVGDPAGAAVIEGYGGNADEARRFFALMTPGDREAFAPIVDWLTGSRAQAEATLKARLAADPLDFGTAGWLARFLTADGDPAAAKYQDWTSAIRSDAAPEVAFEYSAIPASGFDRALSRWSDYPDAIYMRHGPLDLLPPQAVVVGINRGG